MNIRCRIFGHDFKKVYPDKDLIDSIIFERPITEIHVCRRCDTTKTVAGVVGKLRDEDR